MVPSSKKYSLRRTLEIPNLWKIFGSKSRIRRGVWVVVFVVCTILFGYETTDRVERLWNSPKSAAVNLAYLDEMDFPGVTICPGYPMRSSILKQMDVDQFGCKTGQTDCAWDFPWNMATHTETILKICRYKKKYNCNPGTEERGKWHRMMSSLGRCFTYVSDEPIYNGGDLNALELTIDPMMWDNASFAEFRGIRMFVHSPEELPLTEITGINIHHGSNVHLALQVRDFLRVNDGRHSPCDEGRNQSYMQSRCIFKCLYDGTRKRGNITCGAPFMKEFDMKTCRSRNDIEVSFHNFNDLVRNGSFWNKCFRKCPRHCHQRTFTPITTSLGLRKRDNNFLTNVTIYFTDMWLEQIVEKWDYNVEEFVADTGGSLNLFLGASFYTVIQVSDYSLAVFIQRLMDLLRKFSLIRKRRVEAF